MNTAYRGEAERGKTYKKAFEQREKKSGFKASHFVTYHGSE
jgi:hypothetical protein